MFDILRMNGILQIDTKNLAFVPVIYHVIFCEIFKQRPHIIYRLAEFLSLTRPDCKLVMWLDVDGMQGESRWVLYSVCDSHNVRRSSSLVILSFHAGLDSFWTVRFVMFFIKKSLLFIKPAFIWPKIQQKQ